MNQKPSGKKQGLAIAIIVVAGLLLFLREENENNAIATSSEVHADHDFDLPEIPAPSKPSDSSASSMRMSSTIEASSTAPIVPGDIPHEEFATIRTLSTVLSDAYRAARDPKNLIERLLREGYQPIVSKDSNEFTGSMMIVRTQNALPGSRYFHAQYFTDEAGAFYPQHVSFEFRPEHSMSDVIQNLESAFGRLGKPSYADKTWIQWKLPNDYTLWVQRLDKDDISTDPFNAYTPKDVNTIRVALEKNIEGHGDEHEHDHSHGHGHAL